MHKSLIYDQWLSEVVGINSYKVIVDDNLVNKPEDFHNIFKKIKKDKIFVYAKISTDFLHGANFLEESRFKLIETAVKLQKNKSDIKPFYDPNDYLVRFTSSFDREPVVSLATNNFIYSRFHIDSSFDNAIADKIKGKWVENYYKGKRGNYMVVTELDNQVTGFLLLLRNNTNLLTIDLIAVAKEHQGKKMAGNMITFAESQLEFLEMQVSTQIVNIPSIRLHEKLGFRMQSAEYVFHYHN